MFYSRNICNFAAKLIFIVELNIIIVMEKKNKQESSKIRINENVEIDVNDVLFVKDWSEIGDLVSEEEFCDALGDTADEI